VTAAALTEHLRRISALDRVAGLLNWDQETQMPRRGAAQRAEEAGALAAARHALLVDPRLPELCDAAEGAGPDARGAVDIAEARRLHARAVRVPERLAAAVAEATATAHGVWEAAKAAGRFADFAPALGRVVALRREEAACIADAGAPPYDALVEEHEPGVTGAQIAAMFDELRPGLVALRARIGASGRAAPRLRGDFPTERQIALSRRIGDVFGYDWDAGRLDLAVHPSCTGRLGDVRITTRINEANPLECVYSTIHELGHALYEQGLDPEAALTSVGGAASMGVHESQSRLMENQIGRGRAFAEWLYPAMRDAFGEIGVAGPEELYAAVNAVETGFIRTEADEVHYNLHVMMRFELERAVIGGDLSVADLEGAWNERFERDFGRAVPDARLGVLQDVHWAVGAFGYFPTYTLGNVYAAELDAALRADAPGLDAALARGDVSPVLAWLRRRVHRRGREVAPAAIIAEATGCEARPATLIAALERKFGALYALG